MQQKKISENLLKSSLKAASQGVKNCDKSPDKDKNPSFLRLNKDCELIQSLTNRQKQFYLCLLWLSEGGLRPVGDRFIRCKAQKMLGIRWQAFFKMLAVLKSKNLIVQQLNIYGQTESLINSSIIDQKKFLLVPLQTEEGVSIFRKGFDLETYLNILSRVEKYPSDDPYQLPLFHVSARTARYRRSVLRRKAAPTAALKWRQKSKVHINPKGLNKTTKHFFRNSFYFLTKKITLYDQNLKNPVAVSWHKTKKILINGQNLLAHRKKLFIQFKKRFYREITPSESKKIFAKKTEHWSKTKSDKYRINECLQTLRTLWQMTPCPQKRRSYEIMAKTYKNQLKTA